MLNLSMESTSPTIPMSSEIKCCQILMIEIQSIDFIFSSIFFLPMSWSKFIAFFILFADISLLMFPKNNSTGASSGAYGGKNMQVSFLSCKYFHTFVEQWTAELSMMRHILFSFMSINFYKQLANALCTQWRFLSLLFLFMLPWRSLHLRKLCSQYW